MKPLDDLSVVDLSRILSGPVCTMLLADMERKSSRLNRPRWATTAGNGVPRLLGNQPLTSYLSTGTRRVSV